MVCEALSNFKLLKKSTLALVFRNGENLKAFPDAIETNSMLKRSNYLFFKQKRVSQLVEKVLQAKRSLERRVGDRVV